MSAVQIRNVRNNSAHAYVSQPAKTIAISVPKLIVKSFVEALAATATQS
jgi:hypothetical protein